MSDGKNSSTSRLSLAISMMALAVGCKGGEFPTPTASSSPTPTATPSSNPANVGVIQEQALFVQPILPDTIPYYMHEQSSLTTKCQVSSTETTLSKKDIYCILDIQELDLYHTDLQLNFNTPSNMCSYLRVKPYWYYNYEPAPRYMSRSATITKTAASSSVQQDAHGDLYVDSSGAVTYCRYDYTKVDGPDCCEGILTVTTNDSSSGTPVTTVTKTELSGKKTNCIAGPGKEYAVDKSGYPIGKDLYTHNLGVNSVLDIAKPFDMDSGNNVYRSNFFPASDYGNSSDTFPFTAPKVPLGMKGPLDDLLGTIYFGPQDNSNAYYEFGCMDRADDYIARIRVLIRSWDTISGFTASSNPYTSGSEPQFGDAWHDRGVWKDLDDPTSNADGYPHSRNP